MRGWKPDGGLLVSEPGAGQIEELTAGRGGTARARARVVLRRLTQPRGMAFAKVDPLEDTPLHCLIGGYTPEQFSELFTPTIKNPWTG